MARGVIIMPVTKIFAGVKYELRGTLHMYSLY